MDITTLQISLYPLSKYCVMQIVTQIVTLRVTNLDAYPCMSNLCPRQCLGQCKQREWEYNDSNILNTMYFAILVITEFKYQSKMYRFAFTQWRNAQQLGKVSNWPNTRQSKIFTQFPLEGSFKLLENMKCLLTNVKRFQTLHWFFSGQTLRACAYHIIARLSSDIVVCTSSENLFTKKPN